MSFRKWVRPVPDGERPGFATRCDAMHSEVAVDVHSLVQDAHDVDDAFGADPIEERV